jgi:CheY-like chemotaxis protein
VRATIDGIVNLRIEVNDTGQGIDDVFQQALFTPFTQGKYDISNPQGTGLGLSICKRLAKLMDGDIGLNSQVGKGSSFWVDLPFSIREDCEKIPPLSGRFALYQANELIAPLMRDQFAALGVEVSVADSLSDLLVWHSESTKKYQKYIIDIDNLDSAQFDQLYQHVKLKADNTNWLFIRGVNEVKTALSDLIQEKSIASTMKPICQAKLREVLMGNLKQSTSYLIGESPAEEAWFNAFARPPKILLVEDNKVNQMVAGSLLKKRAMQVTVANDGIEAIDICSENRFDLILMDIQMPRMGGIQAMQKIKENMVASGQTPTPIVALTANAMQGAAEEYLGEGMDDYLTKPIDTVDLDRVLQRWLKS